jgi:hypothetical protein
MDQQPFMFLAGYKNISRIRYQQPTLGIKSQIKRSAIKQMQRTLPD